MTRDFRSLLLCMLALWRDLSNKQLGVGSDIPQKRVSQILRSGEIADDDFARLLAATKCQPAEVPIVTTCLQALAALDQPGDLTPEERAEVEMGVLESSERLRSALTETVRRSREVPPLDRYPSPAHLEPARWHAGALWALLKDLSEDHQLAVVRVAPGFRSWALVERLCEESVEQTSRKIERAASLARLAQEAALQVRGPEGWCSRVRGYAAAHAANVLRVAGKLKAAEIALVEAKRLWEAGSDPDHVLDPGRFLDLEGALRRDQRRFEEALVLLDQAVTLSRFPERAFIMKGFTLEVMGEYERAIETLLQAQPLVDRRADSRMLYMLRFNLAVNYCHLGRYGDAKELLREVRDVATDRGDENEVVRVVWLEGRIAAGLGRREEARSLLAQARREFAARRKWYDVALALLEEAVLLLEEGRAAEVKVLAQELAKVFKAKGVHREALAALRLFQEAAEREKATAELTGRILRFLFRARYDQGLRFES